MTDFHVVAHEDDWQLFENTDIHQTLAKGRPTLFIFTTAGDAGLDIDFWHAREEGAKESVRVLLGLGREERFHNMTVTGSSSHSIAVWSYGNTTSYFLRLPDGNWGGLGFPAYRNQSIKKLHKGHIKTISAVDKSTTYQGWQDIILTLNDIIHRSCTEFNHLYAPDYDRVLNPGDHSDHSETGDAVNAILELSPIFDVTWFVGEDVVNRPKNLDQNQYALKRRVFMAYNDKVQTLSGHCTICEAPLTYEAYLNRAYSRTQMRSSTS